jgi:hypothetical protein
MLEAAISDWDIVEPECRRIAAERGVEILGVDARDPLHDV